MPLMKADEAALASSAARTAGSLAATSSAPPIEPSAMWKAPAGRIPPTAEVR